MHERNDTDIDACLTSRPGRFFSSAEKSRYTWSPAAHTEHHENCYFILLSARSAQGRPLANKLAGKLEELNIHSHSLTVVYGRHDLLIRACLTPLKRNAFLRFLTTAQNELGIDGCAEFKATEVCYDWVTPNAVLTRKEIQRILHPSQDIEKLNIRLGEGMLLRYFPSEGLRTFFFIDTAPSAGTVKDRQEILRLAAPLNEAGLKDISAYSGYGFCDAIIECILPSYVDSYLIVAKVQEMLDSYDYISWTLIAPPTDMLVGEALDSIHDNDSERWFEELSSDLSPEARLGLQATLLNSDLRDALALRWERILPEWLNEREEKRVKRVLGNLLSRHKRSINSDLSFMISLATDLNSLLNETGTSNNILSSSKYYDPDAHPTTMLNAKLDTLADLYSSSKKRDFNRLIKSKINVNWTGEVSNISHLHRVFISGDLLTMAVKQEYDENWWRAILAIPYAARLQLALESIGERATEGLGF